MSTTTTTSAYDQITALARQRARETGRTKEQAFTEILDTDPALRKRLADERRIAAAPAPNPDDEAGKRVASLLLRKHAHLIRQADPTLSAAQAFARALTQAGPVTRGLLAGRL